MHKIKENKRRIREDREIAYKQIKIKIKRKKTEIQIK